MPKFNFMFLRGAEPWHSNGLRYIETQKKMGEMNVKTNKKQYHTGEILPSAALAYSELSPYWSVYWSALKRDF